MNELQRSRQNVNSQASRNVRSNINEQDQDMIPEISGRTLRNYFKRLGYKYNRITYKWHVKDMEELIERRKQFVQRLVEYYDSGVEVWFMDECSLCPWNFRQKVWQHPRDPFIHKLPTSDRRSTTIFGAISNCHSSLVW